VYPTSVVDRYLTLSHPGFLRAISYAKTKTNKQDINNNMSFKNLAEYTFENGFFWNNYKSIESDFLRFLEYSPYHESNLKMYSPKLTGMLLQIGGYVDSAFKEMTSYFNPEAYDKKGNRKKKIIVNIKDVFCVFETIYNLSSNNRGTAVAKLDFGDLELYPFEEFSSQEFKSPAWWTAYNKVKHEYSLHYKKASMDNVLNGLAGAFLLNAIHYPSIKILWQLGYLEAGMKTGTGFHGFEYREKDIDDIISTAASEFKPVNIGLRIETPLFIYFHE